MDAVAGNVDLKSENGLPREVRWWLPITLALCCLIALSFDISMSRVFDGQQLPPSIDRNLRDALEICETFGHGFGATLIVFAALVLDPPRRRIWPWMFAGSLGAGIAANALKYLMPRIRPRDFELAAGTVWDTFAKGANSGWGMHSFPSAHTATAVGLAVILSALYPRGRWYFAILALLVGLQRIVSLAHFPSDVCAGAIVGWVVGTICVASMPAKSI